MPSQGRHRMIFVLLLALTLSHVNGTYDLIYNFLDFAKFGVKFVQESELRRSQELPNVTPRNSELFDFIVIGAGSAGSVVAARLSENPSNEVLLLEEGDAEQLAMDIPGLAMHQSYLKSVNWDYHTEPSNDYCKGKVGNSCPLPAGKVMGGSSVINFMVATRGNKADYDNWAAVTGDHGWSYDRMLRHLKRLERTNVQSDPINYDYRGFNGPLPIDNPATKTPMADAFVKAGVELGYPPVDYNGAKQTGFSYVQATTADGERMSVNRAYLLPIRNRKNLIVSMNSRVVKILIDPTTKRAYGVEFIKHNPGQLQPQRMQVLAKKEVILSAGAINSAQLLMLSGVGPAQHLSNLGIPVLKDSPVGYNFMDHVGYGGLTFLIDKKVGMNMMEILRAGANGGPLSEYLEKRTGPVAGIGGIEGIGFINMNDENDVDKPDVELLFASTHLGNHPSLRNPFKISQQHYDQTFGNMIGKYGWTIWPIVLQPKSRGRVALRSANPWEKPKIIGGYFSHPDDLKLAIRAIRMAIMVSKTGAMREYNSTLIDRGVLGCEPYIWGSDDYWECALRTHTATLWNYAGTCKMGTQDDSSAVVDSKLKVKGIVGLRVVDGSVMPMIPRGHTNIPIIAIAERAAALIRGDWKSQQ